jgi:hypothetical protein
VKLTICFVSYAQLSAIAVQRRRVKLFLSSDGGGIGTFSTLLLPPFVPVKISRKSTISKMQPIKKKTTHKKNKIKKEIAVNTVSSDINVQI